MDSIKSQTSPAAARPYSAKAAHVASEYTAASYGASISQLDIMRDDSVPTENETPRLSRREETASPATKVDVWPGAGAEVAKFSHAFWSPQLAELRKIAFKILAPAMILTILVMWACLPVYWGSLWKSNHYTNKLTVRVIDRDFGSVGRYVSAALVEMPTNLEVANDIVREGAWAAIIINAGVTDGLERARLTGDPIYSGTSAISVYYAQARSETAENSYLVPYIQAALNHILGDYNARSISTFIASHAEDATTMHSLARAPATLNNAIHVTMINLRPYDQPVAQAITLVGLIYVLIFSFIVTMVNMSVRELLAPYLTTRSYIIYRLLAPLVLYIPLALFFAMISLPFGANFGSHYTYAGGFFLWVFTIWLGMCSVGLSLEFALTVLGQKFIAFFMVSLIIVNVSVAALPHELQPWIFRYGTAMPFYNVGRIVRTIIFDTKNEVAMNLGILLAWTMTNMATITCVTWYTHRKQVFAYRALKKTLAN